MACDVGTPQFVNNLNGNNGYYQFVVSAVGTPSMCAITLAIPEGYTLSNQCLSGGTLDVSPGPNPQVLGSNENGASGVLANRTCAANLFFLNLVINPGDAAVLNNNIPLAAIQPILPVPTLSQWALGLLALTLLMSGFYWQRRCS